MKTPLIKRWSEWILKHEIIFQVYFLEMLILFYFYFFTIILQWNWSSAICGLWDVLKSSQHNMKWSVISFSLFKLMWKTFAVLESCITLESSEHNVFRAAERQSSLSKSAHLLIINSSRVDHRRYLVAT